MELDPELDQRLGAPRALPGQSWQLHAGPAHGVEQRHLCRAECSIFIREFFGFQKKKPYMGVAAKVAMFANFIVQIVHRQRAHAHVHLPLANH